MGKNPYDGLKNQFIEWLSQPPALRKPRTQIELAEELGIQRETLSRWKQDPEIKNAVANNTVQLLDADDLAAIMYSMKEKAKAGNVQAAKLLLEMSGMRDRLLAAEVEEEEDLTELSDEELKQLADQG